jgi:hypothetical protein
MKRLAWLLASLALHLVVALELGMVGLDRPLVGEKSPEPKAEELLALAPLPAPPRDFSAPECDPGPPAKIAAPDPPEPLAEGESFVELPLRRALSDPPIRRTDIPGSARPSGKYRHPDAGANPSTS